MASGHRLRVPGPRQVEEMQQRGVAAYEFYNKLEGGSALMANGVEHTMQKRLHEMFDSNKNVRFTGRKERRFVA